MQQINPNIFQHKTHNHVSSTSTHNYNTNEQSQIHSMTSTLKSAQQMSQQLSSYIQLAYYKTIEIIYKTWNYHIEIVQKYCKSQVNDMQQKQYEISAQDQQLLQLPQAILVGNIHKIQDFKLKQSNSTTDMLKLNFKTTYDSKQKSIIIRKTDYKAHFIKHFNRMQKNKNQKYLFTHLHPTFYLQKSNTNTFNSHLYFLLQPQTQLIHITQNYYNIHLKPLQRILDQDYQFSNIKLSKIYSVDELDKNCKDGFMLAQVRHKFQTRQRKDNITITGLINNIEVGHHEKNSRNKKQLILYLTQALYRYQLSLETHTNLKLKNDVIKCNQIGRCKIIVRYSQSDQQQVQKLFINNHIYVIGEPQVMITQHMNIIFIVNITKNNLQNCCIFKVINQPIQGINFGGDLTKKNNLQFNINQIQQLFGINLQIVKVNRFLQKSINRNIVKLQVGLLQVQILYGSIKCVKCGIEIKKRNQWEIIKQDHQLNYMDQQQIKEYNCMIHHKEHHFLQLWGTIRAADDTGSCLVSMQHKQIMKFLQLEQYYYQLQKIVRGNGKGMVILSSNKQKLKPSQDPLWHIKIRIKKHFTQKIIIGFARSQLDKTFRQSLTQQQQLQFQISFQNSKKYLQNKKIFPNGTIQKKSQQLFLLPVLKVLQVAQVQW